MDTTNGLTGLNLLLREAREFLERGTEAGFANPQSMTQGDYQGKFLTVNGKKTVDLTRLDYLSLGQSMEVRSIMKECIDRLDISCPCSQMAIKTGSTRRLEQALSDFHGMQDAIVFLSGYSANYNVIQALGMRMNTPYLAPYIRSTGMGRSSRHVPTAFFVDEESHYSLHWGIKTARLEAKEQCISFRFPTADYDYLVKLLEKSYARDGDNLFRVIVTDSVSSMSGKVYDLRTLFQIAETHDCLLYVDEAHSVGSMGTEGRGLATELPEFDRFKERTLIMGTLTKAVAQLGGYVTVPDPTLSCFLRGCSPQYIFSAPLSPWMAEAVVKILDLIRGDYGKRERCKLREVSAYMRTRLRESNFDILGSESQIIPVLIGEEEKGIRTKALLEESGFTASLFMCPAVPKGEAIVRFSLCSDITATEVDRVIDILLRARQLCNF